MAHLGDFQTTDTVVCYFCTVQATGAPTTLSGTPKVRCYKAGSTTESSDITPTVDFDSRTGLNLVSVDLTGDSGFYAAQNDYHIVITAGTVNSVSVVGYVVGSFSVRNRGAIVNAVGPIATATTQTTKDLGAINVTNLNTLSGHDPGATLGTSTLTQAQVTGGAYSVQSSSCVLGDARVGNLDAAVSSRGTSTYAGGAVASVTAPVALTAAYDAAKTAASPTDVASTLTVVGLTTDGVTKIAGHTLKDAGTGGQKVGA